jgi:hypothetical protein
MVENNRYDKKTNEAIYTPHNEVVGGYTGFTMSVRL